MVPKSRASAWTAEHSICENWPWKLFAHAQISTCFFLAWLVYCTDGRFPKEIVYIILTRWSTLLNCCKLEMPFTKMQRHFLTCYSFFSMHEYSIQKVWNVSWRKKKKAFGFASGSNKARVQKKIFLLSYWKHVCPFAVFTWTRKPQVVFSGMDASLVAQARVSCFLEAGERGSYHSGHKTTPHTAEKATQTAISWQRSGGSSPYLEKMRRLPNYDLQQFL